MFAVKVIAFNATQHVKYAIATKAHKGSKKKVMRQV
jgi:hypothetical protein